MAASTYSLILTNGQTISVYQASGAAVLPGQFLEPAHEPAGHFPPDGVLLLIEGSPAVDRGERGDSPQQRSTRVAGVPDASPEQAYSLDGGFVHHPELLLAHGQDRLASMESVGKQMPGPVTHFNRSHENLPFCSGRFGPLSVKRLSFTNS